MQHASQYASHRNTLDKSQRQPYLQQKLTSFFSQWLHATPLPTLQLFPSINPPCPGRNQKNSTHADSIRISNEAGSLPCLTAHGSARVVAVDSRRRRILDPKYPRIQWPSTSSYKQLKRKKALPIHLKPFAILGGAYL